MGMGCDPDPEDNNKTQLQKRVDIPNPEINGYFDAIFRFMN